MRIMKDNDDDFLCDEKYYWYKYKNREDYTEYYECGVNDSLQVINYIIIMKQKNVLINVVIEESYMNTVKFVMKSVLNLFKKMKKVNLPNFEGSGNFQDLVWNMFKKKVNQYNEMQKDGW